MQREEIAGNVRMLIIMKIANNILLISGASIVVVVLSFLFSILRLVPFLDQVFVQTMMELIFSKQ